MGIERIMQGILRYRKSGQSRFLQEIRDATIKPDPSAVFISCMDSRLYPSEFTQTKSGDMFVMRNAGNMAPVKGPANASITAGVDLGCMRIGVKDVVVCGHSDCRAMALLWSMRDSLDTERQDCLSEWVRQNGRQSVLCYLAGLPNRRYTMESPIPEQSIKAVIDADGTMGEVDKLSQVHCLLQIMNITHYPFLQPKLRQKQVRLNAMWFDLYTAEAYMFSRKAAQFVVITEDNAYDLINEW